MASLLDACSPPLIRTVIANPTAGSGLKWVVRAFRGFRRVSAAGGRIGRMSAPEGITAIRASDLGARGHAVPLTSLSPQITTCEAELESYGPQVGRYAL